MIGARLCLACWLWNGKQLYYKNSLRDLESQDWDNSIKTYTTGCGYLYFKNERPQ